MSDNESTPRSNRRLWWGLIAAMAVIAIVSATIWWTGAYPHSTADQSHDPTPTRSSATSPSASPSLYPDCQTKVAEPKGEKVFVKDQEVNIYSGNVGFEMTFATSSDDAAAVDVRYSLDFVKDGKKVTDDLDEEFSDGWSDPYIEIVKPGETPLQGDTLDAPDGWKDGEITLDITIDKINYWCEPAPENQPS